jgi:hypothetical protein
MVPAARANGTGSLLPRSPERPFNRNNRGNLMNDIRRRGFSDPFDLDDRMEEIDASDDTAL